MPYVADLPSDQANRHERNDDERYKQTADERSFVAPSV